MDSSDPCDGCGGDAVFVAAVDGGAVHLCESCREVVASILDTPDDDVPERESYAVVTDNGVPMFVFEDRGAADDYVADPESERIWYPVRRHDI